MYKKYNFVLFCLPFKIAEIALTAQVATNCISMLNIWPEDPSVLFSALQMFLNKRMSFFKS